MSLTYGFYNSVSSDRLYDAVQMSSIMDGVIEDGVFPSIGNKLFTVPNNLLTVSVGTGRAWFNHTWTLNDSPYDLTLDTADPIYSRIDIVAIEINSELATRANSLKIVKGTPASDPVPPTLTNTSTIHQYPLAYVTLPPGVTVILSEHISIKVGTILCPYVSGPLATIKYEELVYLKIFWADEDVVVGDGKLYFIIPSFLVGNVTDFDICLVEPSTSGLVTVQMANCGGDPSSAGTDMLSTKATIDVGEFSSLTAATQPVISVPDVNLGDFLRVDVDVAGTGAKGLDVFFIVEKTS